MLADWYAILDLPVQYKDFQKAINETFTNTNLMLWFPDEDTDSYLYQTNAEHSGIGISIHLPESIDIIEQRILAFKQEKQTIYERISCITQGWFVLGAISSRHFRSPVIPWYWHSLLHETQLSENIGSSEG
jgi:hypothetical protein